MRIGVLLIAAVLAGQVQGDVMSIIETNAQLSERPFDTQPLSEEQREETIRVVGEFVKQEKLLSVARGRHTYHSYLVEYRIQSSESEIPITKLVFTVPDSTPDPRSGLVAKRITWPFQVGKRVFHLKRDANCSFRPYFNVVAHYPFDPEQEQLNSNN